MRPLVEAYLAVWFAVLTKEVRLRLIRCVSLFLPASTQVEMDRELLYIYININYPVVKV